MVFAQKHSGFKVSVPFYDLYFFLFASPINTIYCLFEMSHIENKGGYICPRYPSVFSLSKKGLKMKGRKIIISVKQPFGRQKL